MIRKAKQEDIKRIIELLHQVNMVHHVIRPDLFKPHTTKYSEKELESLLKDDSKPIFVYDDGMVLGLQEHGHESAENNDGGEFYFTMTLCPLTT